MHRTPIRQNTDKPYEKNEEIEISDRDQPKNIITFLYLQETYCVKEKLSERGEEEHNKI